MILINKKRLGIILSCIFVGLFAFSFKIASEEKIQNTNVENNKVLESIVGLSDKDYYIEKFKEFGVIK